LHMVQLIPLPLHRVLLHLNPDWCSLSGAGLSRFPGKEAIKWVSVCEICFLFATMIKLKFIVLHTEYHIHFYLASTTRLTDVVVMSAIMLHVCTVHV